VCGGVSMWESVHVGVSVWGACLCGSVHDYMAKPVCGVCGRNSEGVTQFQSTNILIRPLEQPVNYYYSILYFYSL